MDGILKKVLVSAVICNGKPVENKTVAVNELQEMGSVSRKDMRKGRERLACVCM